MAKTVEEILRTLLIRELPLPEPLVVQRTATLREAVEEMQAHRRPCVLVCEGRRIAGIFTERDVLNRVMLRDVDYTAPVERVMTRDPRTLKLDDLVAAAIQMMTQEGYRHIPLADAGGYGVGLLSARDVLVYIAEHFPAEVMNLPPSLHQRLGRAEGG